MKGGFKFSSAWIMCLVAAVLLQQIVTVSAVYSMSQTCSQISESFIADPNDCTRFGYCKNGVLVGTSQCPKGYVYSTRRAMCVYPSADACSVGNVCQYAADKSFVTNPSDCSSYYYCENRSGHLLSCPSGQIFDDRTNRCVWKSSVGDDFCSANSICRLVPDGKFVGHPTNCGEYVACLNGVGTAGKCPKGTFFNKVRGGCQTQNPCEADTPVGVGLGVLAPLASNPDVCKNLTSFNAWVSDQKTCMGYYVCTSKDGPGTWSKCDPGLHFSEGRCVNAYSVACPYDRCGNMNQEFVGAIGTDCKNYLICDKQTSQAKTYVNYKGLPCPPENPYFDEYSQRCLPTSPAVAGKYVLCPVAK